MADAGTCALAVPVVSNLERCGDRRAFNTRRR